MTPDEGLQQPTRLRRSVALVGVTRQHRGCVVALGEAERPGDERRYPGGIGMQRVHQHDVRLRENLRAHCRKQAPVFHEPRGHAGADRIVTVGVAYAFGNHIDFGRPSR
jgi:hypothetical protein